MERYHKDTVCPKCLWRKLEVSYFLREKDQPSFSTVNETLMLTCKRCEYQWEVLPADVDIIDQKTPTVPLKPLNVINVKEFAVKTQELVALLGSGGWMQILADNIRILREANWDDQRISVLLQEMLVPACFVGAKKDKEQAKNCRK